MALIDKLTAIADAIREKTGKEDNFTLDQMSLEISGIQTGVEMNFTVVGDTSTPSNPSENTIWVNTNTEIISWVFSVSEPESPSEGMVWITTGKTSPIEFNALKKNNIMVYPLSARTYNSGTWQEKEAKIYQNDTWADFWTGQLYENGNQFPLVTGGWGVHDYVGGTLVAAKHNDDYNYMQFDGQNSVYVFFGIDKPIDLSNKSGIRVIGKMTNIFIYNNKAYGMSFCISKTKNLSDKVAQLDLVTSGAFDRTIDVSGLDGEYYVYVQVHADPNIHGYITGVYVV